MTVHELLPEEVLKNMIYPYPYENHETVLEIDDIGHSDRIICMGCRIKEW
jgi:hypothetical protein